MAKKESQRSHYHNPNGLGFVSLNSLQRKNIKTDFNSKKSEENLAIILKDEWDIGDVPF